MNECRAITAALSFLLAADAATPKPGSPGVALGQKPADLVKKCHRSLNLNRVRLDQASRVQQRGHYSIGIEIKQ